MAAKFLLPFLCGAISATLLHQWNQPEWRRELSAEEERPHEVVEVAVQAPIHHSIVGFDDSGEMDRIGLAAGTNKASTLHNLTYVYPKYLAHFRNKPIRLLEIGINQGYSAHMWEGYFPLAELHFLDINRDTIKYFSNRSNYHFFSQDNKAELEKLAERYGPFDIIVDDASHQTFHQWASFEQLFPHVKPGGIYSIEDLHCAYWELCGGRGSKQKPEAGQGTIIAHLQQLIDEVNYYGAIVGDSNAANIPAKLREKMSYYAQHIDSMHFHNSICLIVAK